VHFRKTVLDKYYQQPSKYRVTEGRLSCGGLWGMTIDNHHEDRVVVWLSDLGEHLPDQEHFHWRSHNIPPAGGVSKPFFRQQILGQWIPLDRPEDIFRHRYQELCKSSDKKLGWPFWLPLAKDDAHYMSSLRVPSTDEQKDFDDLVLAMTKILVDSLNEKELNKLIAAEDARDLKGAIPRLEKALAKAGVQGYEDHIQFLRSLQNLRSAGSAHRKGRNYRKIAKEFEMESNTLRAVFHGILVKGLSFLQFMEGVVQRGDLASEGDIEIR
jgi:hypothetical protein